MDAIFASQNWIAVIAGTVVAFIAGWLWYSPMLFGKRWAEGCKIETGKAVDMPVVAMAAQFLALFLLALIIGITAASNSLLTAILMIVTIAMFVISGGSFIQKSRYAICVDASYILLAGALMIVAQGIF